MRSSGSDTEGEDHVLPEGKWEFDGDVAAVFDDMLARSIPQYDVMRKAVLDVGARFVRKGTNVVDLGASRGEAADPLISRFGAMNHFTLVETSKPMLEVLRQRYSGYVKCGVVEVRDMDLREAYPPALASLTQSVLTLQFIPIEHRQRVVRDVCEHTVDGGAFILVEKVLGDTAPLDAMMVDLYYALKEGNGYTQDQIQRKRLSLEGVLVPVTAAWNVQLLEKAGFGQIDCFWRWMNFCAWVAIKGR